MADMPVYVPHVERGPNPGVIAEIERQGYEAVPVLTPKADPYSYSNVIREWWREGTGFIIVEQDAKPPEDALDDYQCCPALVCNRPHNCRRKGVMGSLACVKFSRELVTSHPDLADAVLARRRPLEWWRAGLLVNRPYFPGAARPSGLETACTDPKAAERFGAFPGPLWPTTQEWPHSDTVLFFEMERRGIAQCVHAGASVCFPDPDDRLVAQQPREVYT